MKDSRDLKTRPIKELLRWAVAELKRHDIETPLLDAEVLLSHAMEKDRVQLYLDLERPVDEEVELRFRTLIEKRSARMPVSYLTGHKEFMSLDFIVNEDVLIPRPETEVLVETVCKSGRAASCVLELGTGSGVIAVSLARYKLDWRILATDLSMDALRVARENARRHGVADRVAFVRCDLFGAVSPGCKFDWVVSNPPYIPSCELAQLPAEIREYEPALALDGGSDGLDVIRRIIAEAHLVLKRGGQLAIEIGYGQSEAVRRIADEIGKYSNYSIVEDYSGIPRVFRCKRSSDG